MLQRRAQSVARASGRLVRCFSDQPAAGNSSKDIPDALKQFRKPDGKFRAPRSIEYAGIDLQNLPAVAHPFNFGRIDSFNPTVDPKPPRRALPSEIRRQTAKPPRPAGSVTVPLPSPTQQILPHSPQLNSTSDESNERQEIPKEPVRRFSKPDAPRSKGVINIKKFRKGDAADTTRPSTRASSRKVLAASREEERALERPQPKPKPKPKLESQPKARHEFSPSTSTTTSDIVEEEDFSFKSLLTELGEGFTAEDIQKASEILELADQLVPRVDSRGESPTGELLESIPTASVAPIRDHAALLSNIGTEPLPPILSAPILARTVLEIPTYTAKPPLNEAAQFKQIRKARRRFGLPGWRIGYYPTLRIPDENEPSVAEPSAAIAAPSSEATIGDTNTSSAEPVALASSTSAAAAPTLTDIEPSINEQPTATAAPSNEATVAETKILSVEHAAPASVSAAASLTPTEPENSDGPAKPKARRVFVRPTPADKISASLRLVTLPGYRQFRLEVLGGYYGKSKLKAKSASKRRRMIHRVLNGNGSVGIESRVAALKEIRRLAPDVFYKSSPTQATIVPTSIPSPNPAASL